MAYIQLPTQDIVIPIPDIMIDETVIKRTATLFNMNYNPYKKALVLQWVVKHYSKNADDTIGVYLSFIPDWTKQSIADNTTMCDTSNGHPIDKTYDTGEKDAEGNAVMDYDPAIEYTGQYDYFFNVAEGQQIQVNPMIVQFGGLVQSWDK